jgi:diguanylate cyclase (GGDEF)-like protein/PAS domain S-box-containing protein
MSQKAIRRQTLWLGITASVLALALIALLAGAGLLARQMEQLERQTEREQVLDARAGQLNDVLTAMGDAETGQRGYLLTGKSRYLRPYTDATRRLEHLLQGLDGPPLDDPQDAAHVSQLRWWAGRKLSELAETIRLHDAGRQADALALVQTDVGEGAMERLRSELDVLDRSMRAEQDRLNEQEKEGLERTSQLSVLVVTLLVMSIAVCGMQVALLLRSRAIFERRLARNEAFLTRAGRVAGVGGWEFDLRTDEALWSEQVRTILGVEPTTAPSVEATFGFFVGEARETIRRAVFAARYEGTAFDLELPIVTPAGASCIVRIVGEVEKDAAGVPSQVVGALQDITALVRTREDLERQTATLDTVVEAIPAVVVVLDARLRYRMVNHAFERWRGIDRAQAIGRTVAEVLGQPEFERSAAPLQRALAGETVNYEKEYPDGPARYMSVTYIPMRLADGRVEGLIAVAQDVTRLREEQLRLIDLSERDPLTGLYNRAGFDKCLSDHVANGGAHLLALLYIDLDRFKPVNDVHGHAVGDELLQQFARRLQLLVRGGDAAARVGGDEFAIALVGVADIAGARAVAAKVIEVASAPFNVRDQALHIGASVGVAIDASDEAGLPGLMERADAQLYAAKAAGRSQFA